METWITNPQKMLHWSLFELFHLLGCLLGNLLLIVHQFRLHLAYLHHSPS